MLRMRVYMHSRCVENHPIRILEDGPLIFEVVLSQRREEDAAGRGGRGLPLSRPYANFLN
jgi:hypothetical protein